MGIIKDTPMYEIWIVIIVNFFNNKKNGISEVDGTWKQMFQTKSYSYVKNTTVANNYFPPLAV